MLDTIMKPPLVAEAERIFRWFNKHIFEDALTPPLVSLQFEKRQGIRYQAQGHELVIGSSVESWTPEKFVCEVIHEMVHQFNYQRGVNDCTSNQYHNYEFLTVALDIGFYVGKHRTRGLACTTLNPREGDESVRVPDEAANKKLKRLVKHLAFKGDLLRNVQERLRERQRTTPSKTFLIKWVCQCPPPHNCIRSGRRPDGPNPLRIKCLKCNALFTADSMSDSED